ncbi:MAG TPA: ADP-ribose diphosphatase [Alphaproteobacteria bacterium]|jgi:ADP-ribose pyrophosphatase
MTAVHKPFSDMQLDGVEIVAREELFLGYFRVDRYRLRHRLFAGGMSGEIMREIFERGHAAGVLPYDPVRDEVVLIEQFRPGALAAGFHPWLIEPVAGIIDAGETVEEVVRREAREESGCDIADLVLMHHYLTSPGGTSESCALFCGRVDSSRAGGLHGAADEGEDIRVMAVSAAQAIAWLDEGRVNNALTIIALQWLALNRDKLRASWTKSA